MNYKPTHIVSCSFCKRIYAFYESPQITRDRWWDLYKHMRKNKAEKDKEEIWSSSVALFYPFKKVIWYREKDRYKTGGF